MPRRQPPEVHAPAPVGVLHIVGVTAARVEYVLPQGAAERVHDVETAVPDRAVDLSSEQGDSKGLPERGDGYAVEPNGRGPDASTREDLHFIAGFYQALGHVPGDTFDTTGGRIEAFHDQRDSHEDAGSAMRARASACQPARSQNGGGEARHMGERCSRSSPASGEGAQGAHARRGHGRRFGLGEASECGSGAQQGTEEQARRNRETTPEGRRNIRRDGSGIAGSREGNVGPEFQGNEGSLLEEARRV